MPESKKIKDRRLEVKIMTVDERILEGINPFEKEEEKLSDKGLKTIILVGQSPFLE